MPETAPRPPDLRAIRRRVQKDSRALLRDHFQSLAAERAAASAGVREGAAAAQAALGRLLERDEAYRAQLEPLIARSRRELADLDATALERADAGPLPRDAALGLLSGSGIRDLSGGGGSLMTLTMAKDTRADVHAPPYDDAWTHVEGGRHQQQQRWANRQDGRFGFAYTIGQEGGAAWSGAGVQVLFMRNHPGFPPGHGPAGLAQVRAYVPYSYAWRNLSYLGVAHQHAGFGVFVWSAPLDGGPSRNEQNHQYWTWSDGTSWYMDHNNPGFPGRAGDTALNFQHQAPYFPIEPGRIYGAWIWCFGSGDTSGADALSAAYAQAFIDARARYIVIGQQ